MESLSVFMSMYKVIVFRIKFCNQRLHSRAILNTVMHITVPKIRVSLCNFERGGFLGVFPKLVKETISFILSGRASVLPPALKTRLPLDVFHEI